MDDAKRPGPVPNLKPFLARILLHPWTALLALVGLTLLAGGGLFWRSASVIPVTVDGSTRSVRVEHARTVGDVLAAARITLGPEDLCAPPLQSPLTKQTVIKITRVTHETRWHYAKPKTRIGWRIYLKANLRPVLVQQGAVRSERRIVRETLYDGKVVKSHVLQSHRFWHPFLELTLFDPAGRFPRKNYNLLKCRKMTMLATAYYVGDPMVPGDTTYLGYKLRRGLVAVDPRVIPLRTRLYIKGYGYAYAADTGRAIKGMRIDLAVKDRKEERRFNHRRMVIYLLGKARRW